MFIIFQIVVLFEKRICRKSIHNNTFSFSGQQYLNLTGSTEFALLGKAFNWTCTIQKPPEISSNYVLIKRNNVLCVGIGIVNGGCQINSDNTNYTYHCLSENVYTLIIPADSMTEYEQNSEWYCSFIANVSYRSPSRMLEIASKMEYTIFM